MGFKYFSGGGCDCPPMPDPSKYDIVTVVEIGNYTICGIHYTGCTTFEGKKIFVFYCISERDLRGHDSRGRPLDPHFSEKEGMFPVARFEPTERGWKMANNFCVAQTQIDNQ